MKTNQTNTVSGAAQGSRSRGSQGVLTLTALALAIGGAVNTWAQEGTQVALEEIIVTAASRREEGLQTVPTSIAAVTASDLENRGITDLKSITSAVSGLSLDQPTGPISAAVYMRGVGTFGTSPASQSVGVLVDGIYQKAIGPTFSELFDVQRVEVLRGPQGTLNGKNTTAGVISIVYADPDTEEYSGKVQTVVGSFNQKETRGVLNVPLVEGVLGMRVSGYTAEREGYTHNNIIDRVAPNAVIDREDTRNVDREGWRAKFLYTPTDWIEAKFTVEDQGSASRLDAFNVTNSTARGSQFGLGNNAQSDRADIWDDVRRYIASIKMDIASHTLSLQAAQEEIETFQAGDRDEAGGFGGDTVLTNLGIREYDTYELNWSSDFDGPVNYLLGYFLQKEDLQSITRIGGTFPTAAVVSNTVQGADSSALYGSVTYDITDQWTLRLGTRFSEDDYDGALFNGTAFVPTVETFDETTWSAKLSYQMDADNMLYVAYDKGYKAGGLNRNDRGAGVVRVDNAAWDSEITFNHELGIKSNLLEDRIRLNAAMFYQTYEDFQVTSDYPAFSTVVVENAAEVTSRGVEAEATALVTDILTINTSATWVQSEYDKYEDAACQVFNAAGCTPLVINGVPSTRYSAKDLSGEALDHAPELSINLGAELRDAFTLVDNTEWFARMDLSYRSSQNLAIWQPAQTEIDGYTTVNARIGLDSGDGWKITLWGNNITDEDYLIYAAYRPNTSSTVPGNPPVLQAIPAMEANWGATVDYTF